MTTGASVASDGTQATVTETAAGGSGLQSYGDGSYQFNWKVPRAYAGSCRRLGLDLGEGTPRTVTFRVTG